MFEPFLFVCKCCMRACIGAWVMSQWGLNIIAAVAVAVHCRKRKGGRTRTDKIGVGAGTDIVFPTSKTQVCRTHRPTKSLSAPARQSVS